MAEPKLKVDPFNVPEWAQPKITSLPSMDNSSVAVSDAVPLTPVLPPVKDNNGVVITKPGTATGMSSAYMEAAQSGDPSKMLEFAKTAKGTEFEDPALNAWRGMANRVSTFDEITNAVAKKGGTQSSTGKLELVNQWPKAQNEPSILRGLAEHLMGNPNARFFVSEGMVKPKIIYDKMGKPLQENWTESGVLKNVIDLSTGKEVLPDEYAQRSAGITDVKDTLPFIASKKQLEINQGEANKANHAINDLSSASPEIEQLSSLARKQMQGLWTDMGKQDILSPEERTQLASFASRTVEMGGRSSQSASALDQYTRNGGQSLSNEQRKELSAMLAPQGMKVGSNGEIVDKDGKHVDNSKLKSLQKSGDFGRTFDQSFSQTREDAMNSLAYKKLNAQQQQAFNSILDIQKRIEQKRIEFSQKHGADASLPFLIGNTLPSVGDQYARFQVQQLVTQYNAELTKDYANFRKEQLKNYPTGSAPSPGDIEKAFTRTDAYLLKKENMKDIIVQEMNLINKTKNNPEFNLSKEKVGGEKPEAAVMANKPNLGTLTTEAPTESDAPINMPTLSKESDSSGYKVIPNKDRQFKIKGQ